MKYRDHIKSDENLTIRGEGDILLKNGEDYIFIELKIFKENTRPQIDEITDDLIKIYFLNILKESPQLIPAIVWFGDKGRINKLFKEGSKKWRSLGECFGDFKYDKTGIIPLKEVHERNKYAYLRVFCRDICKFRRIDFTEDFKITDTSTGEKVESQTCAWKERKQVKPESCKSQMKDLKYITIYNNTEEDKRNFDLIILMPTL